jgi:hypothetical protein
MTSLRILGVAALSLISTAALASNPADYNQKGVPTASNFARVQPAQLSSTSTLNLDQIFTSASAANPATYNEKGVPTAANFGRTPTQLSSTAAFSDNGASLVTAEPSTIRAGGAQ